jgi:hypothetical protein
MPSFVYRPNHPEANENGMVDRLLVGQEFRDAPHVISDSMPETRHMATGRVHTSKSKFRQDTRASGCIEVGNDRSVEPQGPRQFVRPVNDKRKRRDDIGRAIYELRNGRRD